MNDLQKLREANQTRQKHWPGPRASTEFRVIEFAGEAGEVSNAVKKLIRHDNGTAGNTVLEREALVEALKEEIGDVLITIDMVAERYGIDLADAFVSKFNKTSRKVGIGVLIHPQTLDAVTVEDPNSPFTFYDLVSE
jgi:NTP pyrophosphatase (non-canonical NTP hydrolase)